VRSSRSNTSQGAWLSFAAALAARALVASISLGRVRPAMDGTFYDVVARRIAEGQGYTWLWPDGAVTYAAHYPVGYPALLGAAYAVFGANLGVAFALNALFGSLAAPLAYALASECAQNLDTKERRRVALIAGLCTAFLPTLVLYTPALMTESLVGTLLLGAVYIAARAGNGLRLKGDGRMARAAWVGLLLGLATLVRPQTALFGPVLGWTMGAGLPRVRRALLLLVVTVTLLATVAPWTLRNCARMDRCLFVSANGGWNLLIGTFPEGKGGWAPVEGARVPPECREVYPEAQKDECFGRAARSRLLSAPMAWLGLVPDKLKVTFDYTGAAAEYLTRAGAISEQGRFQVGALEIVTQRLLFLAALGAAFRVRLRQADGARAVGFVGLVAGVAALGYLGLGATWGHIGLLALLGGARPLSWPMPVVLLGAALGLTALVHAVFFGAGRYCLPLLPLFAPLAALVGTGSPDQVLTILTAPRDNSIHGSD
jgi:4-amino-4-deoxy-L-arabinose transferase-like glycosyltransferase